MTQKDLAQCARCSLATIQKIESDERRPSRQMTLRLADCLNVPSEERATLLKVARRQRAVEQLLTLPVVQSSSLNDVSQQVRMLPRQSTRFVGRAVDLALIAECLAQPDCRLLTLTGPGGIGKTRLAIQAAQQTTGFANGIFFIPLAPLLTANFLVPTIAEALGAVQVGPLDPQAQLVSYLQGRQLLLILDNFEHLLDGVGLLSDIVAHAPGVRLLVTSRQRLNLQDECLCPVGGLALPQDEDDGHLQEYDAVQLFINAARRVQPDFSWEVNRSAILQICQVAEGMPLGITLAAAQLYNWPCQEIADRLCGNLDVLSSSLRDVPERHRSIRNLFEQSWNQLTEAEQDVLASLSVFRGGFTLAAAEQVAGASPALIRGLAEKSLVQTQASGRYDLHELLRQFAGEKLAAQPAHQATIEQRHCAFYTGFLAEREAALCGSAQREVRREVDSELANVNVAWQQALAHRRYADLEKSANSLLYFYSAGIRVQEGLITFAAVTQQLEAAQENDPEARRALAQALTRHSWSLVMLARDPRQSRPMCERSVILARELGWPEEEGLALLVLAMSADTFEEVERFCRQGMDILRAVGHVWGMRWAYLILGSLAAAQGRYDEATGYLRQLLLAGEEVGDIYFMGVSHYYLGKMALWAGHYIEAQEHHAQSLALARQNDFPLGVVLTLTDAGLLACWKLADYAGAKNLLLECLDVMHEVGAVFLMPVVLTQLGSASYGLREYAQARGYFGQAIKLALAMGQLLIAIEALLGFGLLLAATGAAEQALELLVFATHHAPSVAGSTGGDVSIVLLQFVLDQRLDAIRLQDKLDALRAELEARLPAEDIATALEQGQARSLEEIAAELLSTAQLL